MATKRGGQGKAGPIKPPAVKAPGGNPIGGPKAKAPGKAQPPQGIPPTVAQRMARRIAIATGVPTLLGIGVFVASYLLVSRGVLEIPTGVTLVSSGGLFLLGLLGLSYGVFSSSWEEAPGSLLGVEQIRLNLERLRASGRQG